MRLRGWIVFLFSLLNTVDSRGLASTVDSFLPWKSSLSSFESPSRFLHILDHPRLTAPCFVFTCFGVCSVTHAYIHTYTDHTYSSSEKNGRKKKRNERRRLACVYHSTNFAIRKKKKTNVIPRNSTKYLSIVYFNTPRSSLKLRSKCKSNFCKLTRLSKRNGAETSLWVVGWPIRLKTTRTDVNDDASQSSVRTVSSIEQRRSTSRTELRFREGAGLTTSYVAADS